MLLGLLTAVLLAPIYWLVVPSRWRREFLIGASLIGLAAHDPRLVPLAVAASAALFALVRAMARRPTAAARFALCGVGLALLAALFFANKLGGGAGSALPSQAGLALLGVSYLVLKGAAVLIEAARGALPAARFRDLLEWLAFLPTYPSGPMETYEHFTAQAPRFERARFLGGLERILFGLVKALLLAHYLGVWTEPLLAAPQRYGPLALLGGLYAFTLRFYFDFSGYSDIAIGLAALYGYDIEENFDRPLLRRNLTQFWQHWHITLTRWLRTYLFIPVARRVTRFGAGRADRAAVAAGQIAAMTFCGLWHGVAWSFVLWGFLHALGLIWVGIVCRDLGRRLPSAWVRWWRESRVAYALSTAATVTAFSVLMILLVTDIPGALRYLGAIFRA